MSKDKDSKPTYDDLLEALEGLADNMEAKASGPHVNMAGVRVFLKDMAHQARATIAKAEIVNGGEHRSNSCQVCGTPNIDDLHVC